jgi:glutamate-1-semialdehyde 2,1-aminomutase
VNDQEDISSAAVKAERTARLRKEVSDAIPASAARPEFSGSIIPGGTTRNRFWWPTPVYLASGRGATVTDIDGKTYIDCNLGFGPLILGHGHPAVLKALHDQVDRGVLFGPPNEAEAELASLLVDNVPGAQKVVFTSSGTEATLGALRLARAVTGRQKVAKFEGGWHGVHDFLFHSYGSFAGPPAQARAIPDTAGIADAARDGVTVLPFNDDAAFERVTAEAKDLACVIVEPVQGGGGAVPAQPEFLRQLRELCTELGILLILDEVITGFRLGASGGAGYYEIEPDLVTLGKVVGGGMNVGALCGPARYMDLTIAGEGRKPVSMGGTHSANPMTMAAGRAQLEVLLGNPGETYGPLNRLGERLRSGLTAVLAESHVTGWVTGLGSLWGLHFTERPPSNIRDQAQANVAASRALAAYLLLEGILVSAPMHLAFLSTAHTDADVDAVIDAHRRAFARMKDDGWLDSEPDD